MLRKTETKVTDEPGLIIEQDNLYREMKRSGDTEGKQNERDEPCPCKWPDN